MGVIAKQSSYAAIALGIGMVIGAANNMVVLPRAFESNEAMWGLVRIMTSWGLIFASLSTLGAPGAIVRFLHQYADEDRPKALNSIIAIAIFGILLTVGSILIWGEQWILWMDPSNAALLSAHAQWFIMMMVVMSLMHIFRAVLIFGLRTGYVSWIDEVWQKSSYIILGLLLLFDVIGIEQFVAYYVGTYGISLVLLAWPSRSIGKGLKHGFNTSDVPRFAEYSAFSLFAGGALIVAGQLDYIMIGKYLGLEEVPIYTLGFFVGSVVAMPARATASIVRGVLAHKIHSDQSESIGALNKNSARVNVLLMTCVMAGIWAGFDPFQQLLPEKYRGLEWVFLCIGFSRVIEGLNISNNSHLGLSEHYRLVLPVNLALVVVTVAMNYVFLVTFEWGLAGAALATLGTYLWNNAWRLWLVWRKLGVHPFTWSLPVMMLVGSASAILFHWTFGTLGWHPILEAISQGLLASGTTFIACYVLGYFPEFRTGMQRRVSWWP
ncbi:MAG: lipopolysaccharide biosynthesis protein [Flavobacteriales bacterium]